MSDQFNVAIGLAIFLGVVISSPVAVADPPHLSPTTTDSPYLAYSATGEMAASGSSGLTYAMRLGLSADYALSNPKLYGMGTAAEATLVYGPIAVGLRLDAVGMIGFGYTERYSAGARFMAGSLGKFELLLGSPTNAIPSVGTGQTQFVLGAAIGTYRIAAVGGSVSREIAEEREDGVDAFAFGGRAYGIAPQFGFQKKSIRLSLISHLVIARSNLDPVFALELAWQFL